PFVVVVLYASDDVADLSCLTLLGAGGAQRMVEDDDALRAADAFDERLAFRVVDAPHLGIVEEIADPAVVRHKAKALALEPEAVGERAAVMHRHAMGLDPAALDAAVAAARRGDMGDELLAAVGEVGEAHLDRVD